MKELDHIVSKHREQRIFRLFRFSLRFNLGLFYLAFGVIDYLYLPNYWLEGLGLRIVWYFYVWVAFLFLRSKSARQHSNLFAAIMLIIMCWEVNWLILRSGGYSSFYITGLFLINVIGLQVIGFSRSWAIGVDIVCFIPTLVIIWMTSGLRDWRGGLIQSAFVFLTIGLAWFYKATGDQETVGWALRQLKNLQELESYRRTEYLKRSFPAFLRHQIEDGIAEIPKKKIMPQAVLGFADISSSTSMANELTLNNDWELKENFLESAIKRATQNNLIVLSQQGDGCFFLANYQDGKGWPLNVIAFFENLLLDYQAIKAQLGINVLTSESGVKFGIAMGPAMLGFIGQDQPYFTANGPVVNLAARLCAEAGSDELVIAEKAWEVLRQSISGWDVSEEKFDHLKGFRKSMSAVRIRPRLQTKNNSPKCAVCGASLTVVSNPNGFLDVKCSNGHGGDEVGIVFNEKKAA